MEHLSPSDLSTWANAQAQRPLLLDVREAWECQTASAQHEALDAVYMPMQTIPARLAELDKNRPIACLCHHGMRSLQVAQYLAQQGYEVANITGGIHAWSALDPRIPVY